MSWDARACDKAVAALVEVLTWRYYERDRRRLVATLGAQAARNLADAFRPAGVPEVTRGVNAPRAAQVIDPAGVAPNVTNREWVR